MSAARPRPTSPPGSALQTMAPVLRVEQRRAWRAERDRRFLILVNAEDLETRTRRIEIAGVQRVAMAQAG